MQCGWIIVIKSHKRRSRFTTCGQSFMNITVLWPHSPTLSVLEFACTFVPTLCSQPVLRSQHVCLVHWTHRCLCSPVARQQNFTRVFLHHDLEVIVSCDTQKCNHSWLAVTTRRRELTCSNIGEDSLWAHTSMGCCAARTKLHPESSFCRSLRNSLWAPSIQWVAGCCQSCSGPHTSLGD